MTETEEAVNQTIQGQSIESIKSSNQEQNSERSSSGHETLHKKIGDSMVLLQEMNQKLLDMLKNYKNYILKQNNFLETIRTEMRLTKSVVKKAESSDDSNEESQPASDIPNNKSQKKPNQISQNSDKHQTFEEEDKKFSVSFNDEKNEESNVDNLRDKTSKSVPEIKNLTPNQIDKRIKFCRSLDKEFFTKYFYGGEEKMRQKLENSPVQDFQTFKETWELYLKEEKEISG